MSADTNADAAAFQARLEGSDDRVLASFKNELNVMASSGEYDDMATGFVVPAQMAVTTEQANIVVASEASVTVPTPAPAPNASSSGSLSLAVGAGVGTIAAIVAAVLVHRKRQHRAGGTANTKVGGDIKASAKSAAATATSDPNLANVVNPMLNSDNMSAGEPTASQEPLKQDSKAKLSKRALEIYAMTNPVAQSDDSEPTPTLHI